MDWEVREIEKYFLTKKDPKYLYQNIKNMTPAELKEIFKKNYIPETKTKEDLFKEVKYKKVWKDPGYCNGEFMPLVPLRGKILNEWEASRVTMPYRSYERYPVSKAIKNDLIGKDFGFDENGHGTTKEYKLFLEKHKEKFNDYVYRPSKYTKINKFLPQILMDKPPFNIKKSTFGEFGFPKHNAFLYENRFRTKK